MSTIANMPIDGWPDGRAKILERKSGQITYHTSKSAKTKIDKTDCVSGGTGNDGRKLQKHQDQQRSWSIAEAGVRNKKPPALTSIEKIFSIDVTGGFFI